MKYIIEKQYVDKDYTLVNTNTIEVDFNENGHWFDFMYPWTEKDAKEEGYDYKVEYTELVDEYDTKVFTWYNENEEYIDYFIRKK